MFHNLLILGTLLLITGCAGDRFRQPLPAPIQPEIKIIQAGDLADLGHFSRAVSLETHEQSLLGNIESVKLDRRNGDILAADLRASKSLYRFDAEGRFKARYGRPGQGPGEYETLVDFAVMDDGTTVLLTTFKLIAFYPDGRLLREAPLGITGFRLNAWGETLVVYGMKAPPRTDWVLWCYDRSLQPGSSFHSPDPKLAKLLYLPRELMASDGDRLYVGEPYDLAFSVYTKDYDSTVRFRLPNNNQELDPVWKNFTRTDANIEKIGQGLHRIENMHAFDGWLHFQELGDGGRIARVNLLDPERNVLYRFQGARPMLAPPSANYLSMDAIAGHFDKGVIGVLYDPGKWHRYRQRYPQFADITFQDTDNPLLLFFEYRKPLEVGQTIGGSAP